MLDHDGLSDGVRRLLKETIETPTRLEVLLFMRHERGKSFHSRAVASVVHVTERLAEAELAMLCGRGFLTVSMGASDVLYTYAPSDPAIDSLLAEIERLHPGTRTALLRSASSASSSSGTRVR